MCILVDVWKNGNWVERATSILGTLTGVRGKEIGPDGARGT